MIPPTQSLKGVTRCGGGERVRLPAGSRRPAPDRSKAERGGRPVQIPIGQRARAVKGQHDIVLILHAGDRVGNRLGRAVAGEE